MDTLEKQRKQAISKASALFVVDTAHGESLAIVNKTIIDRLLDVVPLESLTKFLRVELSEAPQPKELGFGVWVSRMRERSDLTQIQFAERLSAHSGLKVHGSDIGNIEKGLRQGGYSEARLSAIRKAILEIDLASE